jgi:hypothetical protein
MIPREVLEEQRRGDCLHQTVVRFWRQQRVDHEMWKRVFLEAGRGNRGRDVFRGWNRVKCGQCVPQPYRGFLGRLVRRHELSHMRPQPIDLGA